MSAAAAAALASVDALQPGHGQVEAGLRIDSTGPRGYVDAEHKFMNGLGLYAEADMASLTDYEATAGLRYTW